MFDGVRVEEIQSVCQTTEKAFKARILMVEAYFAIMFHKGFEIVLSRWVQKDRKPVSHDVGSSACTMCECESCGEVQPL